MSQRRVYLHVGTPKSGTSYLQDKLALNRDELERQGLEYLRTRTGDHFEAALDLIGERWAGEEKTAGASGTPWPPTPARSRRHVLISHEILAAADAESVARAMASFPRPRGPRRRHGARPRPADPGGVAGAGQAPRRPRLRRLPQGADAQLPRTKTGRCGSGGCSTCPGSSRPGAPPCRPTGSTWSRSRRRRARATRSGTGSPACSGWTRGRRTPRARPTNASLGGAEVTMLRRLNVALAEQKVPRAIYVNWVRETHRPGGPGRAPGQGADHGAAEATTAGRADHRDLAGGDPRARSVDVVGDLDDLEPLWPDGDGRWPDPDRADPERSRTPPSRPSRTCSPASGADAGHRGRGAVARLTRMLRS